jgi:hypothetical protein
VRQFVGPVATDTAPSAPAHLARKDYVDAGDTGHQPLDADLTTIAGLAPSNGALMKRVSGAWAGSTLVAGDIPDLSGTYQALTGKGAVSGYAGLDAGSLVPVANLPTVGRAVARNVKTASTTTTATTGATGTIELSTIASVLAGRTYLVRFRTNLRHSVANSYGEIDLRYTTNNTEPVVGSTLLTQGLLVLMTAATVSTLEVTATYDATAAGTFRVAAFAYTNVAGTLTVAASATNPTEITIHDVGPTLANTGTAY